ncbi:hypothetical protein H5410_061146 [Solanum commersonii]|uniref:Uncharacterized protein n=1 Tax=Solanum commersonii TaxID=4109 RepID=A0A9J5W829_SOLCO|nr:hypothetical protein H5410_061146 [Solanum commersonii]
MHILSLYLMKILKFQVFDLRDKARTQLSKKEQIGESSIGLKIAFCSSSLSLEGKGQVGDEMKQSAYRRTVLRSNTISPNDSKCKEAKG